MAERPPQPRHQTRDQIAAAYDSPPWWYDLRGFVILTFAYNSSLGRQIRLFSSNIGQNHLEVACGTGTLLGMVLRRRWRRGLPAGHVTGIDYAEPMLAGARRRFKDRQDIELQHADAADLPFADQSFDTANIANSVHCLPRLDASLKEVQRVLKPGGTLAANVLLHPRGPWPLKPIARFINEWGMRKGILHTPYDRATIRQKIVDSGFEIVREQVAGNCYDLVAKRLNVDSRKTKNQL